MLFDRLLDIERFAPTGLAALVQTIVANAVLLGFLLLNPRVVGEKRLRKTACCFLAPVQFFAKAATLLPYARGRPIAFLAPGPDDVSLRISNPGDYSIFILSVKLTPPAVLFSRPRPKHTNADRRSTFRHYLSSRLSHAVAMGLRSGAQLADLRDRHARMDRSPRAYWATGRIDQPFPGPGQELG
jgi:hypothetical protein